MDLGDRVEKGRKTGGKEVSQILQPAISVVQKYYCQSQDDGDGYRENGQNREIFKKLTKNWQNFVTGLVTDSKGEVTVQNRSMVPNLDVCVDVYVVSIMIINKGLGFCVEGEKR